MNASYTSSKTTTQSTSVQETYSSSTTLNCEPGCVYTASLEVQSLMYPFDFLIYLFFFSTRKGTKRKYKCPFVWQDMQSARTTAKSMATTGGISILCSLSCLPFVLFFPLPLLSSHSSLSIFVFFEFSLIRIDVLIDDFIDDGERCAIQSGALASAVSITSDTSLAKQCYN